MSTFTFTLPSFGDKVFEAHTKSQFHPIDEQIYFKKYEKYIKEIFEEFSNDARSKGMTPEEFLIRISPEAAEIINNKKLTPKLLLKVLTALLRVVSGLEYYYRYFFRVMEKKALSNPYILVGDIIYIETDYESRQYYGRYVIGLDNEGNKKVLSYGDSGLYRSDFTPANRELFKVLMDKDPEFFIDAEEEILRYVIFNYKEHMFQDDLTSSIKDALQKGGRRTRQTRRARRTRRSRK